MLTLASCLSGQHTVTIFWNDKTILDRAEKKFGIDLKKITLTPNIFSSHFSFFQKLNETKQYDAIIYLSDGSIPFILTKKLIIHFQFPVEWVSGKTIRSKLKIARTYKVFCNSAFTKQYIDRKFHIDSQIIYPPIDEPLKLNMKKENIILTVGRYGYLPNGKNFKKHDVMIKAFKKMIDKGLKNWKLIIAISYFDKDKEQVEKLKKIAKGYPIIFIENTFSKDLQTYYAKAKIYWHASGYGENIEKNPDYAEHFGMSTVEAMSYGAVPIVISAGGQKEIVNEGKNGFLWNTEEEFIEKTQQVMSNPGLQNTLAKNAKLKWKEFNKEEFSKRVLALVQ